MEACAMEACISTTHIKGLELESSVLFPDNRALIRINTPENKIMAMWIIHDDACKRFNFTLYLKVGTTLDECNALIDTIDRPLPGSSGKTFTHDDIRTLIITPTYENALWERWFNWQSRKFTPLELCETSLKVKLNFENVEDDTDITDVITCVFGMCDLIRDDVDTKPAHNTLLKNDFEIV